MGGAIILVIVSSILSSSGACAEPPLAPGKPAGIKRAQSQTVTGAIAIGALTVIAIAGYAVSTSTYHIPGSPAATAATSTQP